MFVSPEFIRFLQFCERVRDFFRKASGKDARERSRVSTEKPPAEDARKTEPPRKSD